MSWQSMIGAAPVRRVFPWLGGRRLFYKERSWLIIGDVPREWGWYTFMTTANRKARLEGKAEPNESFLEALKPIGGYVVGDRLIPLRARVDPDPNKFIEQTIPIFLLDSHMGLFPLVYARAYDDFGALYVDTTLDSGPEQTVREAFVDRRKDLKGIRDVSPALDLAFRFASLERERYEAWKAKTDAERLAEERRSRLLEQAGTAAGRRELAKDDFEAAARAAIEVGGATFLRVMPTINRHEMAVQYAVEGRQLECVANKHTLRIVDSGICLTDEVTRISGDTRFTLESLPSVVREAVRRGKLVVYRHV